MTRFLTRKIALALFAGAVFFPLHADAAVIISEVAWMGTAASANDEWIELYNNGSSAVSLEGWVLSDNVSLSIPLSGSLAPGAYGVLERTDDGSAPGAASLTYTGALSNDGRTLTLRRDDASIEDQVAGGSGWSSIGGDNTTKETAQYTGSGWVTAVATPGEANATSGTPPGSDTDEEEEEHDTDEEDEHDDNHDEETEIVTTSSKTRTRGGATARVRIFEDDPLKLSVSHMRQGHVHQPVQFVAIPSGLQEGKLYTLKYTWNFGDGMTSDARAPEHVYTHPGNYVVVASAERAEHEAVVRTEIVILPVEISLSRNERGDVLVHNDAKYEIDVSGMQISDGTTTFALPPNTYILPNAALALSAAHTGLQNSFLSAHDRTGVMLAQHPSRMPDMAVASSERTAAYLPVVHSEAPKGEILATSTTAVAPETQLAAVSASFEDEPSDTPVPFEQRAVIGFVGILLISLLALYSHKLV